MDRQAFPINDRPKEKNGEGVLQQFTAEELKAAAGRLKSGKAPGPDGIRPEAVKAAVKAVPDKMLELFNLLLERKICPSVWREARVVLIPKGVREGGPSYRPVSLLNVFDKLYEHLLRKRIENQMEKGEGLSGNQFGFRKGRSTIDAISSVVRWLTNGCTQWGAVVLIDIRNAFNTAVWSIILQRMGEMGIDEGLVSVMETYFGPRSNGTDEKYIGQGVAQGSVLGPTLWNILYDPVLRIPLPAGCATFAYADDLAFVVRAESKVDLMGKTDIALARICVCMRDNKLEVATE